MKYIDNLQVTCRWFAANRCQTCSSYCSMRLRYWLVPRGRSSLVHLL